MERTLELQRTVDQMSLDCYGMTQTEALEKGICLHCKEPAIPKCYSRDGVAEYNISALCEPCWDELMREEEDDDEC